MSTNAPVLRPIVATLARQIERKLWANYCEYLAECEADYANGHRAHYCEHGSNNWTDYDNICGYCEDGISMRNGVTRRQYAIAEAKERVAKFERATRAITELHALNLLGGPFDEPYVSLTDNAIKFITV